MITGTSGGGVRWPPLEVRVRLDLAPGRWQGLTAGDEEIRQFVQVGEGEVRDRLVDQLPYLFDRLRFGGVQRQEGEIDAIRRVEPFRHLAAFAAVKDEHRPVRGVDPFFFVGKGGQHPGRGLGVDGRRGYTSGIWWWAAQGQRRTATDTGAGPSNASASPPRKAGVESPAVTTGPRR